MPKEIRGNRVWVSVARKVNLGNYENVDLAAGLDIELSDNEDPEEFASDLFDTLEALVQSRAENYNKPKGSRKRYED